MRKLLGFGAAATVSWDDAATSLNSNMGGLLAQGDSWMTYRVSLGDARLEFRDHGVQSAGAQGASVVGPTIDSAGNPGVTQPLTQKAWTLNSALQAVNPAADASKADAEPRAGLRQADVRALPAGDRHGRGGVVSTNSVRLGGGVKLGALGFVGYWLYESWEVRKEGLGCSPSSKSTRSTLRSTRGSRCSQQAHDRMHVALASRLRRRGVRTTCRGRGFIRTGAT